MYRKWLRLLLLIGSLLTAQCVLAREVFSRANCAIEADTIIDGSLFVLCQELRIDGTVNGDLIGGAALATINGRINGNIYLIAGQLDIRGSVKKDIHFGGATLRINPPSERENDPALAPYLRVRGDIKAVSLSIRVFENTLISDGIMNLGYQLILHGNVNGEVSFWGSALHIDGSVHGNIYATVGNPESESRQIETLLLPLQFLSLDFAEVELFNPGLVISEKGRVVGDLAYKGPTIGDIQGTTSGQIIYVQTSVVTLPTLEQPGSLTIYILAFAREFTTLLAIGAFIIFAVPHLIKSPMANLRSSPFASFSVGMLTFILSFPIVLLALLLSISVLMILQLIGLSGVVVAVGIVLALVNLGGVSVFYFVAIFVARVIAGLALGRVLLRGNWQHRTGTRWEIARLALGVLVLSAMVSVPVVGFLINAAALFLGLGAILTVLIYQFRHLRETNPTPAPAWYAPSPAITRERPTMTNLPKMPISSAKQAKPTQKKPAQHLAEQPGMRNLPEGFDLSFFDDEVEE